MGRLMGGFGIPGGVQQMDIPGKVRAILFDKVNDGKNTSLYPVT
jgi:hypothetical protein